MVGKLFKATVPAVSLIVSFKKLLRLLDGFKRSIYLFFKQKESMHSIAMNTLNACFSTSKATRQELLQEEEHSDLHQSIQCFD